MSNAHDIFVARYKAARARMGMDGSRPIRREPKQPLDHIPSGIYAIPKQRVDTLRIRKHAAARNQMMRRLIDDTRATTPLEIFGLQPSACPASISEIQRIVAEHFEMSVTKLISPSRQMNVSFARQIAVYLARLLTRHSLVAIGHLFGGLDHTTVLHAIRRVEARIEAGDAFAGTVSTLRHKIVGNDVGVYYGA